MLFASPIGRDSPGIWGEYMDGKDLVSPAGAVEFLFGESGKGPEKTLANWRSARTGPPFLKIGGRVMYERAELERYRDSCRVPTMTRQTSRSTAA